MTSHAAALLAGLLALAACDSGIERGPDFSHYLDDPSPYRLVEVLSGKADRERREILIQALDAAAIPFEVEEYPAPGGGGANVVAEIGGGQAILVIVAHYDRVPDTPGANDNASCVAAAMAAYGLIREAGAPPRVTVRFLFSDDEETGHLGAIHHAERRGSAEIAGVMSLEMCGIGDAFGVWDVHGRAVASLIARALEEAGEGQGVYNGVHGPVARFSSDHAVFAGLGIAAVGVTAMPREDEETLRDYVDNPDSFKWLFPFLRPTIFRAYHGPGDLPSTVDPKALDMMAHIVFQTVLAFDRLVAAGTSGSGH